MSLDGTTPHTVTTHPTEDWHPPVASVPQLASVEALSWEELARDAEQRVDRLQRRVDALERALESRPAIEQAKGVIMSVFGVSADSAFEALTWVSQNANVKLAVVADRFIAHLRDVDFKGDVGEQVTRTLAQSSQPPDTGSR